MSDPLNKPFDNPIIKELVDFIAAEDFQVLHTNKKLNCSPLILYF